MGFETYNPNAAEPPINGPFGQLLGSTLGAQQDEEVAALRLALLCRLPSKCPDDALDALGGHFRIPRYDAEPHGSYRARLEAAFATWEIAGSDAGIEAQLRAAGIADVRVYADHEGTFGPGSSGAWHTRFWTALGPDWGTWGIGALILGAFTLGGTTTLGSTATLAQIRAVKRIILKWKAHHGYPVRVLAIFGTGAVLGVGPLTLGSFTLGGATVVGWDIGRTLADTVSTLGFTLGTFEV